MIRTLKIDLFKMFGGFRIYACILAIAAGFMMYALQIFRGGTQSYVEDMFSSVRGAAIILLFMLCVAGGSFLYCVEEKNGCLPYEVRRAGLKRYTVSKTITSAIGGFVTALMGQLLTLAMLGLVRWLMFVFNFSDSRIFLGGRTLDNIICSIFLTALYCGVLSVVAFLITTLFPNFFVAMTMPLLLHYLILSLSIWIKFPKLLSINLIYAYASFETALFGSIRLQFLYALFFSSLIGWFVCRAAQSFIGRRLERG